MRTICLDFDGVIHSYMSGWKGARNIPDPPVPGAFVFIADMLANGWDVCIHSSRSGYIGGRKAMRKWLCRHAAGLWDNGTSASLCRVRFPLFKPAAFVTLDDRALQFTGRWPSEMELRAFKPWNKRP